MFEPTVSYASMSNNIIEKILTSTESQKLKEKLITASEVNAKMDDTTFSELRILIDNFSASFHNMNTLISQVLTFLQLNMDMTNKMSDAMRDAYMTKERMYRYQLYSMDKNFIRAFEAMEERTLTNVASTFVEFGLNIERRVRRLVDDETMSGGYRRSLYELILDALETRQQICHLAKDNISEFISAYKTGTPIFEYKFEDLPRRHNKYIVPRHLLNSSISDSSYMEEHVPRLETEVFETLDRGIEWLKEVALEAYNTSTLNDSKLGIALEEFYTGCRSFRFSKSVVYSLGITLPSVVIEERKAKFDEAWKEFQSEISEIKLNIRALDSSIDTITDYVIPRLEDVINYIDVYSPESNATLLDFASLLLANETDILMSRIRDFFLEVDTRGQVMIDMVSLLRKPIFTIWGMIINDEDSHEYYAYTKNEMFLRNLTVVKTEWLQTLDDQKSASIRNVIMHKDDDFTGAARALKHRLGEFEDSLTIDSNFIK